MTESLFSMDSDHPDFQALVEVCQTCKATLLVDVAHDLGVLGPNGRGVIVEEGVLEAVDIVVGSFSKTFASIGGFAAFRSKPASCVTGGAPIPSRDSKRRVTRPGNVV